MARNFLDMSHAAAAAALSAANHANENESEKNEDSYEQQVAAAALPSFSQVWCNQNLSPEQQQQLLAQMALVNRQTVIKTEAGQQAAGGGVSEDSSERINGQAFR